MYFVRYILKDDRMDLKKNAEEQLGKLDKINWNVYLV